MEISKNYGVFFIVLVVILIQSCATTATYKGKKLINERFTYWENYDIYVDTSFVEQNVLCSDSILLDSAYVIQHLYKKTSGVSKRKMIKTESTCLQEASKNKFYRKGLRIELVVLVGQSGDVMAFRLLDTRDKNTRKMAICYSKQKYDKAIDPICFTRESLVITIGAFRSKKEPLGVF